MPYSISLSDGTFLCSIPDSQIVNTYSGLSLVGRGYDGYGQAIATDLVHMTENFSASTPPTNPLTGSLWYDLASGTINFYNGTAYKSFSIITVSASSPINPNDGDQWYDTVNQQVFIWTGSQWLLIGPLSSAGAGLNGFVVGDVTLLGTTYYFLEVYADNRLVAIISSDTLTNPGITGFGNINPGINFVSNPASSIVESGIYNLSNLSVGNSNQFTVDSSGDILTSGNISIGSNANVAGNFIVSGTASFNTGNSRYTLPTSVGAASEALLTYGNGVTYWGESGNPTEIDVTFSATPVFDCSQGNPLHPVFFIGLTGNVTSSTLTNVQGGMLITFHVMQIGDVGGFSFVAPYNVPMADINSSYAETVRVGQMCTQSFNVINNDTAGLVIVAAGPMTTSISN